MSANPGDAWANLIYARLTQLKRESGISFGTIAREAGIGKAQLSRFMQGETRLGFDTTARLCRRLGLELRGPDPAPKAAPKTVKPARVVKKPTPPRAGRARTR